MLHFSHKGFIKNILLNKLSCLLYNEHKKNMKTKNAKKGGGRRLKRNRSSSGKTSEEFRESESTHKNHRLYQNLKQTRRRMTSSILSSTALNVDEFMQKACQHLNFSDGDINQNSHCYGPHALNLTIPRNIGTKTELVDLCLHGIKGTLPSSICLLTNLKT